MLRFTLRGSFFVLLLLVSLTTIAQSKWPNTLLWRITGKGLAKPSYLYGTMHLQDKRLFQFGDSLYHALEHTDGFAIEIDANELMDSVMTKVLKEAEEEALLERQKVKLNRQKLNKTADSLLRSFGIKGDVATKKDLKKIRDRRLAKLLQQGEMPTIVDAYLLGMAMRMNKWTGGIEDVNDQLSLSDELGGSLEPEAVLQSEEEFRKSIEQMIAVYLSQDLDKIDEISNRGFSKKDKDLVLIRRNVKMAYRMDSLSHVRSMFFAVGAAHLPGDSGVISLLRNEGYVVEPVFSTSKISADVYASHLKEKDWVAVEGEDAAYTVQMPGKPSDYNMFSELKMKMYFDLTTMTYYLTGNVSGSHVNPSLIDGMIKEMVHNIAGKKAAIQSKNIQSGSLHGKEAYAQNEEGSYRIRLFTKDKTVFILMVGALKKANVNSVDADRFFTSFVPGNTVPAKKEWQTFSLPEKAFSVKMPGKPTLNESMDERIAEAGNWRSVSYQALDQEKGIFYLVQVRELKEGFYLDGDSAYFETIQEDYKTRIDKILKAEVSTYRGYPAMYLDGYLKQVDAVYKTLHVTRANRVYTLIAGVPKGADVNDADTFLQSLTLLPFEPAEWSVQSMDGFSSSTPSPFYKEETDSSASSAYYSAHYYSYHPKDAVTYDVFKEVFSPTYWVANDSIYFNNRISQYVSYNDSLLKKEWVQNGNVKGLDMLIELPGYNSYKKVRQLVNGDTLYTLFSMIPRQDIDKAYHQRFFNDFRIANEVPPTIYTSKAPQLLKALQSTDSLTFADALENLELVEFEKKDLPLLHQALLVNYSDGNGSYSAIGRLVEIVSQVGDSTTISFVKNEYPRLPGEKATLQYELLALLAKMKTSQSFDVLKQFILTELPKVGNANQLQYALYDSLPLTATLYPDILQKSNDSLLGYTVVVFANQLLDSSLLSIDDIRPYQVQLLQGAKIAAANARQNPDDAWQFVEWSAVLSRLNNKEGNALLRQMLSIKDLYVKQYVITALLKNNVPVSSVEINKVAADKGQRVYFYEELKKLKKENLFPAQYATQKSLAESDIFAYLNEDFEEFTLTYVGERIENYGGKKQRFYLFKVRMAYDEEERMQNFLAVAGPYELNSKERVPYGKASGIYMAEEFHPTKINRLLKAYLKEMEPAEE